MRTTIETLSSNLDRDFHDRVASVNEIIDQAVCFDVKSEISGRRTSGNICAPKNLKEERILVVPGQFMSTAINTIAINAAIAEATGLAVVGLELPGHGNSDKMTKTEKERSRDGDYRWLADDYSYILENYGIISQFDSARRFIYGISAGALSTAKLVEFGDNRYEKVAFLEPANLAPRGTVGNVVDYIREAYFDPDVAKLLFDKYEEEIHSPRIRFNPRVIETFLSTYKNVPWRGETSDSIVEFMEKYKDVETAITVCAESRVVAVKDLEYFDKKISESSEDVAQRVSLEILQEINHNIGRHPLAVGQLAARSFE